MGDSPYKEELFFNSSGGAAGQLISPTWLNRAKGVLSQVGKFWHYKGAVKAVAKLRGVGQSHRDDTDNENQPPPLAPNGEGVGEGYFQGSCSFPGG